MAINFDYDPKWKPAGGAPDAGPDFDYDPAWKPTAPAPVSGGLVASAKQAIGSTIKGAGQLAADFIPGVGQDSAVTRYGKSVVDANPTRVTDFDSLKENPLTAVTEATGNAAGSMGAMLGARALGQGITAASPLAGPAAPLVAGLGQAVSWAGPAAVAALPSFGGIREKQIQKDPNAADSTADKLKAAIGAGAVGAIESRFGPQEWAMKAMTKEGRNALAEKFAANSLAGSVAKGAAKGAAIEGAEELAQNPIEQVAAGDNPMTADSLKETAFGGVMGALGGGVLGGASGAGFRKRPEAAAQPAATPANPTATTANPLATPGENIALQQQILDEHEQLAASINPADGPLSSAASLAVQTGAAKTPTQLAIEERQRAAELATQQDDAESEIYNSTGIEDQADNLDWMRLLAGEQTDLADLRDKAQFEAKQRQSRQAGELRDAKEQMLAEGAYEADQRRSQQQAQQAADPGLPFERIAPEDYDTLNPVKLGEGEIVRDEPRQLPPPRQRDALPPGNRPAPALGFTPKAPDPMQATEDGLVGTARQFDELRAMKRERKDQMRRASELAQSLVRQGATLQGKSLVAPSGRVLAPQLTLPQYRAVSDALKQNQTNAQQNPPQATPAQAQQAETQGQEQPAAPQPVAPSPENQDGTARPSAGSVSGGSDSQGSVDARSVVDNRADRGSGYERAGDGDATAEPAPRMPGAGAGGKRAKPTKLLKRGRSAEDVSAAINEIASLAGRAPEQTREAYDRWVSDSGRDRADEILFANLEKYRRLASAATAEDAAPAAPREAYADEKAETFIAKNGGSAPPKAVEAVRIGARKEFDKGQTEKSVATDTFRDPVTGKTVVVPNKVTADAIANSKQLKGRATARKLSREELRKGDFKFAGYKDGETPQLGYVIDVQSEPEDSSAEGARASENKPASKQPATQTQDSPSRPEAGGVDSAEDAARRALMKESVAKLESLPDGWTKGENGLTRRPVYRYQVGPFFAVVQNPVGDGYEIEYRQNDKVLGRDSISGPLRRVLDQAQKSIIARSGQSTHQDPGQPVEAVTPAVVAKSIQKSARNTEFNPSEAKKWLLGEIDRAISNVPAENAELAAELAKEKAKTFDMQAAERKYGKGSKAASSARDAFNDLRDSNVAKTAKQIGFVTFDVPGDGKFKVMNTVDGLNAFRSKVEKSSGFKAPASKPPVMERETDTGSYTPRDALADGEYLNAYELARLQGKPLRFGVGKDHPNAYADASDVEGLVPGFKTFVGRKADGSKLPWTVIEESTGLSIGDGGASKAAAIAAAKAKLKVREQAVSEKLKSGGISDAKLQSQLEAEWVKWAEEKEGRTLEDPEQLEAAAESSPEPSPLATIFSDLDSTSTRKANKASRAAQSHPKAAEIDYVQKNFHDVLLRLMEEGKLTVNGVSSVSEENSQCL